MAMGLFEDRRRVRGDAQMALRALRQGWNIPAEELAGWRASLTGFLAAPDLTQRERDRIAEVLAALPAEASAAGASS